MTAFREDTGTGTPGPARQRVDQLMRDAWGVRRTEDRVWVRWPFETLWEEWRVMTDKTWAQMERKGIPAKEVPS